VQVSIAEGKNPPLLGASLADPDVFYRVHRNSEKGKIMWQPGDSVVWRGIYRNRIWHVQTVIVVKDTTEEIVVALLPGTECIAPEGYLT